MTNIYHDTHEAVTTYFQAVVSCLGKINESPHQDNPFPGIMGHLTAPDFYKLYKDITQPLSYIINPHKLLLIKGKEGRRIATVIKQESAIHALHLQQNSMKKLSTGLLDFDHVGLEKALTELDMHHQFLTANLGMFKFLGEIPFH